jgi:superfamily II DNA or RNA helicase
MQLSNGIYEQVINDYISNKLKSLDESWKPEKDKIDIEDSKTILANYLSLIIRRALGHIKEKNRSIEDQIAACNHIIHYLSEISGEGSINECHIGEEAEILLSLYDKVNFPEITSRSIIRPETSISQSSLFTGSAIEPAMAGELKKEILTSDRIEILVSFIKWGGIRLIADELKQFSNSGRKIRIITTSYMGATDYKAIEFLESLANCEVKISYDTKRTRLHAKAYTFYRNNGFSTAYIGSSNLSNPAITSGLEWNVKITEKDNFDLLQKVNATFETYWNDSEFIAFRPEDAGLLKEAINREKGKVPGDNTPYTFEITPYHYQKEILEKLKSEREIHKSFKNLIVAATGTGKTVISAFDYKDFYKSGYNLGHYPKLLFVAHREEILKQSLYTFRGVLRDQNFGSLLVGSHEPDSLDHLFISVQSFNSRNLWEYTGPDYYDMIIIDEFHHAAANSYQKMLSYYKPKILVGLTATPERMDNLDILKYFDGKIAAEIRLAEAIDRKLLSPFHYFGVTDVVDPSIVQWSRGGYDRNELSKVYTGNTKRAYHIADSIQRYVTDVNNAAGLGFCVSIEHAIFMAEVFNEIGIKSAALHSNSSQEERSLIQERLTKREINFIFVVDLYNEGVDIPEIDTVLFLRPTESITVFLQQLGRGLRLHEDKECLTVLDFVGRQNAAYRFGDKLGAILEVSTFSVKNQIETRNFSLPKGCHIHLEKIAMEKILENIKANLTNKRNLVNLVKSFEYDSGLTLTLKNFLDYHAINPVEFYSTATFIELCRNAEMKYDSSITAEEQNFAVLNKLLNDAVYRLITVNSVSLIRSIISLLKNPDEISEFANSDYGLKVVSVLYYSVYNAPAAEGSDYDRLFSGILDNEWIRDEIVSALEYVAEKISFIEKQLDLGFKTPLKLHCTYSRDQIFAGLGHYTPDVKPSKGSREGVVYFEEKNLDVFFITLNKTEKHFSPSTMYEDYAINERLFHWQSQSTTSENSPTGRRYIDHKQNSGRVLLFARESKKISGKTRPYMCLGTAEYVSHTGSRPMNIIWKLDEEIPAGFLKAAMKMT